jgi:aspartate aminotransferase
MKKISDRAKLLTGQPMFHVLVRAKELEKLGHNILHFEIGDPSFPPPKEATAELMKALNEGHTHYCNPRGLPEFIEGAQYVTEHRSRKFRPSKEQILVTNGANSQIGYVIECVTDSHEIDEDKEEVIIPNPCFPTYISAINFAGAKPVLVDMKEENDFRLNPADVEKAITDKTRLIILNSPSNPTGSVNTPDEIRQIYELAKKHDIYLLSDEIYSRMIYPDSETQFSSPGMYDHCKEHVIVANGFSKSYAMTGFRIGSVMGPEKLIEKMVLDLETNISCVAPFIQKAALAVLLSDQQHSNNMMKEFRERRDLIYEGLNSIPGIRAAMPKGAFYIFPNISGTGLNDKQFETYMMEKVHIACCGGSIFGENLEKYARFSYATSTKADIKEAIDRMRVALQPEKVKEFLNEESRESY